jgi:hypothetical protein
MSDKLVETIKFKLGLSGSFWEKRPAYSIRLDGQEKISGSITSENEVIEYLEFEADIEEDQSHILEICLLNKTDLDCFVDENGMITKDMLLNIESIEIEDIDLGILKWSASEFTPNDQTLAPIKGCVNLGWNGSYRLEFNSPFYLWLLDNL